MFSAIAGNTEDSILEMGLAAQCLGLRGLKACVFQLGNRQSGRPPLEICDMLAQGKPEECLSIHLPNGHTSKGDLGTSVKDLMALNVKSAPTLLAQSWLHL